MFNFLCFIGVFVFFISHKIFALVEFIILYTMALLYSVYKKISVKNKKINILKHMKNIFFEWFVDYKDIRTYKYIYQNGFKAWLSSLPTDIIYNLAMNSSTPLQRHIWKIENMFTI